MSDDDWRVEVGYSPAGAGRSLVAALREGDADPGLVGHGVIASLESDEDVLFLYAGTRELAERAQRAAAKAAAARGVEVTTELRRWHPVAEEWEPADAELPQTPAQVAEERALVDADERLDSQELGHGAFDVVVSLESRRDAVVLAEKLDAQGLPNARRWRHVVLGAADETTAAALAQRLQPQLPPGASVSTVPDWDEVTHTVDQDPVAWPLLRRNAEKL